MLAQEALQPEKDAGPYRLAVLLPERCAMSAAVLQLAWLTRQPWCALMSLLGAVQSSAHLLACDCLALSDTHGLLSQPAPVPHPNRQLQMGLPDNRLAAGCCGGP